MPQRFSIEPPDPEVLASFRLPKEKRTPEQQAAIDTYLAHGLDAIVRLMASGDIRLSVIPIKGQPLSAREREILQLHAEGLDGAAVARRLFISPHTVHSHLQAIRHKLGATTTAQAVHLATREGHLRVEALSQEAAEIQRAMSEAFETLLHLRQAQIEESG